MNKIKFAFIVHSRYRDDIVRKYQFLKYLPNFLIDFVTFNLRPIKVSKITGLIDKNLNEEIFGIIIGIPMTARQLLENRSVALRRIIQAVNKASNLGAKYIALGAMTSSLSRSGLDIIDNIPKDISITTGRTYTAKNICDYVVYYTGKFNLDISKTVIAIVGAAGGIGSSVAINLSRKGYRNFILVDLERKLSNLYGHIEKMNNYSNSLNVESTHKLENISKAKFIIAATSSPEIVIKSSDVNSGSIIINDAQPSDIDPWIIENRKDVIVVEGGVLHTNSIDCHFNFGLHHKNDIFSCLAEAILLTYQNINGHKSIREMDLELLKEFEDVSVDLGFKICPQNILGEIKLN